MYSHPDILEQPDRLSRWLASSVALHVALAGALVGLAVAGNRMPERWGSPTGGGWGSVAVTPVAQIPLPQRSGPQNPVANDTESQVPTPPPTPKAKPKPKAQPKQPDAKAVALKSRNAQRHPQPDYSAPNKYREQQKDMPNQVYSRVGQAVNTPLYGMRGGGGVGVGDNSPFGTQFGWYAKLLVEKVGQSWRTSDLDQRIENVAVVTFVIRRDGSVTNARISQRSGNAALDFSAQRAILDAAPFAALPPQFPRNEAEVELRFSLK
jgi:protein TonB